MFLMLKTLYLSKKSIHSNKAKATLVRKKKWQKDLQNIDTLKDKRIDAGQN